MVTINGTQHEASGKTVAAYLAEARYDLQRVAVERNGEIVPKAKYAETVLQDGDVLEVVSFVGGG
ncbi:MAG: sulfur carrier protein ThiS [Victivallales bacterium]|nr:sulfur carrier protein ThiS [Victivallales bacterium]